jgi:hypothetical protein
VLNSNEASPVTLITIASANGKILIDYDLIQDGTTRIGTIMVVSNGTLVSVVDQSTEAGVTLTDVVINSAVISGPNIEIQYTSGINPGATLKYSTKRWN